MSIEQHPDYTAEQALARLKEGNERFVNGQARFPTVQAHLGNTAGLVGAADLARPFARRFRRARARARDRRVRRDGPEVL